VALMIRDNRSSSQNRFVRIQNFHDSRCRRKRPQEACQTVDVSAVLQALANCRNLRGTESQSRKCTGGRRRSSRALRRQGVLPLLLVEEVVAQKGTQSGSGRQNVRSWRGSQKTDAGSTGRSAVKQLSKIWYRRYGRSRVHRWRRFRSRTCKLVSVHHQHFKQPFRASQQLTDDGINASRQY